ncbi:rod shape-determining protein MreB, partial [Helicobacter pylori]
AKWRGAYRRWGFD